MVRPEVASTIIPVTTAWDDIISYSSIYCIRHLVVTLVLLVYYLENSSSNFDNKIKLISIDSLLVKNKYFNR